MSSSSKKKPASSSVEVLIGPNGTEWQPNQFGQLFMARYRKAVSVLGEDSKPIPQVLQQIKASIDANELITTLVLSQQDVQLSSLDLAALGSACAAYGFISALRVTGPRIGTPGLQALVAAWLSNDTRVKSLEIVDAGLDAEAGALLGGLLRVHPALELLVLDHNPLEDAGVVALSGGVPWARALATLSLEFTQCGQYGAAALGTALSDTTREKVLAELGVTAEAMQAAPKATKKSAKGPKIPQIPDRPRFGHLPNGRRLGLPPPPSAAGADTADQAVEPPRPVPPAGVLELRLKGNVKVASAGCYALFRGLESGSTLQRLDLSDCGIGDDEDAAGAAARALAGWAGLRELRLASNFIGESASNMILDAIAGAQSCEKLTLPATAGVEALGRARNVVAANQKAHKPIKKKKKAPEA